MDCLFCKIVDKSIKTDFLIETDTLVAFKDINPQAPHHILIIPREHIATLNDTHVTQHNLLGEMITTAKGLATKLGIAEDGYRLIFNTNGDGGQTVYHIHLHLLGGRPLHWPPG